MLSILNEQEINYNAYIMDTFFFLLDFNQKSLFQ